MSVVSIPMTPSRIYGHDLHEEARSTLIPFDAPRDGLAYGLVHSARGENSTFFLNDIMNALVVDDLDDDTARRELTAASRALRNQCAPLAYRLAGGVGVRRAIHLALKERADIFGTAEVEVTYLRHGLLIMLGSRLFTRTLQESMRRGGSGFDKDVVQSAFAVLMPEFLSNHERITLASETQAIIAGRLRAQVQRIPNQAVFPDIAVTP